MDFISEIRDFFSQNGIAATETVNDGFGVFVCGNVNVIPVSVSSVSLEVAEEQHVRLSDVVSVLPGKKVLVPEDMWRGRSGMMRPRLLAQLGRFQSVFARNTVVSRIGKDEAASFLDRCHSYRDAASRYRYGVFTKAGELVAVASFSSGRTWVKEGRTVRSYEWVRYASLPDVRVVGGMGKVLKAFEEDVHPDDIMSYADMEWTDGAVYERLGFIEDGIRPPVQFVIDPVSWVRTALSRADSVSGMFYHLNMGSVKYRLARWH